VTCTPKTRNAVQQGIGARQDGIVCLIPRTHLLARLPMNDQQRGMIRYKGRGKDPAYIRARPCAREQLPVRLVLGPRLILALMQRKQPLDWLPGPAAPGCLVACPTNTGSAEMHQYQPCIQAQAT
jgi:hypothetical protein